MQSANTEGLSARELDLCREVAKALENHAAEVATAAFADKAGLTRQQATTGLGSYLATQQPGQQLRCICLLGELMQPEFYTGAVGPHVPQPRTAVRRMFRRAFR
jgi:hypothetical protein